MDGMGSLSRGNMLFVCLCDKALKGRRLARLIRL